MKKILLVGVDPIVMANFQETLGNDYEYHETNDKNTAFELISGLGFHLVMVYAEDEKGWLAESVVKEMATTDTRHRIVVLTSNQPTYKRLNIGMVSVYLVDDFLNRLAVPEEESTRAFFAKCREILGE